MWNVFSCRQPFIKQYNLEDFEFSPAHLFFWDKVFLAFYTFITFEFLQLLLFNAVLRIRIRRIHMFLGLADPDLLSQIYGSGSFYHQSKNSKKNNDSYCFVTSHFFMTFYL